MRDFRAALLSVVLAWAWIPLQAQAQLGSLVVTMNSPAPGSTVSGSTTVSASVSIVGLLTVQSVQFQLDGNNLGAADSSSPYAISWNTAGASNGAHTLTAVATATLGLQFTSNAVTVTVSNGPPPDTTPPAVSIVSPGSGQTVTGTVTVSASASDNVGIVGVQFLLDGSNFGAEDTASPYSVAWNTAGVANGSHTLAAVARDAAGNRTASASVAVTVSNGPPPDTTPPTVSITSPASGATVSGTVTIAASASDNIGVVGVQFFSDGAALGAEDTTAPYAVAVNTASSSNGSHTLTAVARDAAGNRASSAAVTVTVSNGPPPDTTPPTVGISSPANGATVSGTVTLAASASDNVGVVGVQFFGDGMALGAEDTTAPYSMSVDTTSSSNGAHALTAVARDAAGNRTTSAPVTVTVNNGPPPDTTPPTVSISSPASGATVSGTVTLTANASDNVGVVGVQFFGDGMALGAEDAAAPYSISVDTTTSNNGPHTLTAVARDAAGNVTTSSAVTVTVSNGAPVPVTRFEDTDPSVVYTAGWGPDVYAALSNGGATVSDVAGAQAMFTFTGTSVSWIGGRSFETGIARVFLDGAFVAEIDTYSKTKEVQVPLFTMTGLSNSTHTLMIEVTGQKNAAATLAFVLVDAFDVPAATISRLQETDPAVVFTGAGWLQGDTSDTWSGGTTAGSLTAGDRATFTFNGTGVRWLGESGPQNGGIARVFLDGTLMTQVDTYAPANPAQHSTNTVEAELFKASGLADGSHTLAIEVTGQQDPAAVTAAVTVDAFDVTTSGTRHQETDPAIAYSAGWIQDRDHPYSEGTAASSTTQGDRVTFTFTGTAVSWIGFRGPGAGIARVSLDGTVVADSLDTYLPKDAPQETVFALQGLAAGSHTLTIDVTGLRNLASSGTAIVVDAFDVAP